MGMIQHPSACASRYVAISVWAYNYTVIRGGIRSLLDRNECNTRLHLFCTGWLSCCCCTGDVAKVAHINSCGRFMDDVVSQRDVSSLAALPPTTLVLGTPDKRKYLATLLGWCCLFSYDHSLAVELAVWLDYDITHYVTFIYLFINALRDCTDHTHTNYKDKYYSPDGLSVTCTDSQTYYLLTYNKQLANYETYLATYLHALYNKLRLYSNCIQGINWKKKKTG